MDQLKLWRELMIDRALDQGKDVERYRHDSMPVFWWYVDLEAARYRSHVYPVKAEFLYWEIYRDHASAAWIILGAVFATTTTPEPRVQPFMVRTVQFPGEDAREISFEFESEHLPHAYCGDISVHVPEAGMYAIRAASVKVLRVDPTGQNKETELIKQVSDDFSKNDSANSTAIDEPCPMCGGAGSAITFAIPKADQDSGLSGYALYSCNTINGAVACVYCDGEGARFEEWYLDEDPQRRATLPEYRSGTGKFLARRPPASGRFNGWPRHSAFDRACHSAAPASARPGD